jgi:peroxiredoxin Q/BCP
MEAYRDQYATLFNNGRKVVVIGISVDPDTALASWARDSHFPVLFASDSGGKVGAAYGAYDEARKIDNRSLYVIGPDGTIAYKTQPFRVLVAEAYTELGDIIDKLSPPPPPAEK